MNRLITILLVILLITMLLAGCGGADPEEIQGQFLAMLEEPATEETVDEVAEFLDNNVKYMIEEEADQMLLAYSEYAFMLEGSRLDYYALANRYNKYISSSLQELFQLLGVEQEAPTVADASLKISWEELCARILSVEEYISANKEYEPVKAEAVWLYENYINDMFMGATKTPIFSYETGDFSEEAYAVYKKTAEENPDSTAAWAIGEYFEYLASIGNNLNYRDAEENKTFFATCNYLVSEAGKRVYQ